MIQEMHSVGHIPSSDVSIGRAQPVPVRTTAAVLTGLYLITCATLLGSGVAAQDSHAEGESNAPFASPGYAFVNTTELVVPNAQEVVLDLPSAFHWSRHQRGQIGPWTYILYPDGTAKIMEGDNRPAILARLFCQAGVSCRISKTDGPDIIVEVGTGERPVPPTETDLDSVARYLARWILAGTAPPPAPIPVPVPDPVPVPVPEAAIPEVPVPDPEVAPPTPVAAADTVLETLADDPDATAATPTGQAPVPGQPVPAQDDPVCSESEPFVPDACAQPTEPLVPRPAALSRPAPAAPQAPPTAPTAPAPAPAPASEQAAQQTLIERFKLNCSITGTTSLAFVKPGGVAKPRASLGCSARLSERLSVRLSLIGYLNAKEQQDWDPDYTYAFTYRVSDKINLGYSNYSARFAGAGSPAAGLLKGKLRASYKLPPLRLPNDKSVFCSASLGLPRLTDESLNLSCGYAVTKKLRIGATSYLYMPNKQGTYQPDYSYTASYRFNDDWLLSYNNYSNNRWPWNRGEAPGPGLTGGSLSLTYKFKF